MTIERLHPCQFQDVENSLIPGASCSDRRTPGPERHPADDAPVAAAGNAAEPEHGRPDWT
jgi:hypothetical protein